MDIVRFHTDELQAVREGEQVWVVVKRVCEALGIADQSQATKIKTKAWAITTMIVAVAEDGKKRAVFCVDLRSLPMWLATIEPSKVKPRARAKLELYQKECHDVLARHFFGELVPRGTLDTRVLLGAVPSLIETTRQLQQMVSSLVNQRALPASESRCITKMEEDILRRMARSIPGHTLTEVWKTVCEKYYLKKGGPAFRNVSKDLWDSIQNDLREEISKTSKVAQIHGFEQRPADPDKDFTYSKVKARLEKDYNGPVLPSSSVDFWWEFYELADVQPLTLGGERGFPAPYLDERRYQHLLQWIKRHPRAFRSVVLNYNKAHLVSGKS